MAREGMQRGMVANTAFHKKIKKEQQLGEEEVIERLREKKRRIAENMGWNDDWYKR